VQLEAREQFKKRFAEDYVATEVESNGGTMDYILEPAVAIAGLRLPERAED
jgi:hypothetical protein